VVLNLCSSELRMHNYLLKYGSDGVTCGFLFMGVCSAHGAKL